MISNLTCLTVSLALLIISEPSRDQRWQEDLDSLASEFPRRHKNAFFQTTAEAFAARAAEIREAIPDLTDAQVEAAFMGLISMVGDSHSKVVPSTLLEPRVPLRLHWFADGLFVTGTSSRNRHLLGGKVQRLEGWTLTELAEQLGEYFAFGNESWMRHQVPARLTSPRLLHATGIALSEDELVLEVELADGTLLEETVAAGTELVTEQIQPRRQTATARRAGSWHHHEYLEEDGILYVQYNRCDSDAAHPVPQFGNMLAEVLQTQPVQAFVFDVQYNGGGNSLWGTMLLGLLAQHPPLKEHRNVYCLIGRSTFSSASMNARDIKKMFGAEFVGEPTGGAPRSYGEIKNFRLPHSQLLVYYSTKYFVLADLDTPSFEPDHPVAATFEDYREGRDVLLEKVRELMRR